MNKTITSLLALSSLAVVIETQASTVINFDDLTGSNPVPANYQGLTWTGWQYYDSPQSPYNPSSPNTRIYNDPRDNNNRIDFGQTVTFEGLWLAGYAHGQYVIGYQAGNPVFSSSPQLTDGSEFGTFVNVSWSVDAISIHSDLFGGVNDYYIVDDVTFSGGNVPDSGATLSILGGAMSLLSFGARRLRK